MFILFFGHAFIHFNLAIWYGVSVAGWETLGQVGIHIGLIITTLIIVAALPFMYYLHINYDNKYVEEVDIPLFKFKIHNFNSFIVISYYDCNWVLKRIDNGYDLKEKDCIPFRNYYDRNGEFNYAVPSIRYIK